MKPRPGFGIEIEGCILNVQLGIRGGDINGWRQYLVMEGQGRFDEAGRAGRRLGVTDLRFNASQGYMLLFRIDLGEDVIKGGKLSWVPGVCPGSMAFDQSQG